MGSIENNILDAMDIIMNQKVRTLTFDRTIRATIEELVDSSIGKYKVNHQNSSFYAYSANVDRKYSKGTEVYVVIHSNDFEKNATILDTVSKLGINYITALSEEDKYVPIGSNVFIGDNTDIKLCSYHEEQVNLLINNAIDLAGVEQYKDDAENLMLSATFRTDLPQEQRTRGGNYGLILHCEYLTDKDGIITKEYLLDINNMIGQPYAYSNRSRQYAIFKIPGKDLKAITGLSVFCRDFPIERQLGPEGYVNGDKIYTNSDFETEIAVDEEHIYYDKLTQVYYGVRDGIFREVSDIFIETPQITFVKPLTNTELQGSTLNILTPEGAYFDNITDSKKLSAVIKIKGNKVNYDVQKIDFYWFTKNSRITAGDVDYSIYGGAGWKCINNRQSDGSFKPESYQKVITARECPSRQTTFKCVGVYSQNNTTITVSNTVKIENKISENNFKIEVVNGKTTFVGDEYKTLRITPTVEGASYYWAEVSEEGYVKTLPNTSQEIEVYVSSLDSLVRYEVAIYQEDEQIGNAEVNLMKIQNDLTYRLILNNGNQIFKYNEQGVAPNSYSIDKQNRLTTILPLTFDIYDSLGNNLNLSDEEKISSCNIRWIWCGNGDTSASSSNTMITTNYVFQKEKIQNVDESSQNYIFVLKNEPQFEYDIRNSYDVTRKDNNIRLEVTYEGVSLIAQTNLLFTKEGELGTNGSLYTTRILPNDEEIENVFIRGNNMLMGYYRRDDKIFFKELNPANAFKAQVWDGGTQPVFSSTRLNDQNHVEWSNPVRPAPDGLKMVFENKENNITINPGCIEASSIARVEITSRTLSEDIQHYYADYPINESWTDSNDSAIPLVLGGYNACMYESDGTRPSYSNIPFQFVKVTSDGTVTPILNATWTSSWGGKITISEDGRYATIAPPKYYIGENLNNYVKVEGDNQHIVYISFDFYLNRYGLQALNNWNGTEIAINSEGTNYILAPQMGAGIKESDGTFTGIAMGTSYYNGSKKNGLFGYSKGAESFFLDAGTGNARFGVLGQGNIVLGAEKLGAAPAGSIFSGNYYTYGSNGIPSLENGEGMLINLKDGVIKYGSGAFMIDSDGSITSTKGNISGWVIGETSIYSKNATSYISSIENETHTRGHDTLDSTNEGFYLGPDGISFGNNIKIMSGEDGGVFVGNLKNKKHWTISGNKNGDSYIGYQASSFECERLNSVFATIGGQSGDVYFGTEGIRLGNRFAVDTNGYMVANQAILKKGYVGNWIISEEGEIQSKLFVSAKKPTSEKDFIAQLFLDSTPSSLEGNFIQVGVGRAQYDTDLGYHYPQILESIFQLTAAGQLRIKDGKVRGDLQWYCADKDGENFDFRSIRSYFNGCDIENSMPLHTCNDNFYRHNIFCLGDLTVDGGFSYWAKDANSQDYSYRSLSHYINGRDENGEDPLVTSIQDMWRNTFHGELDGQVSETSDRRLKTQIEALETKKSIDFINQLKPVQYKFKKDLNTIHHGFIAQDVNQIVDGWNVVKKANNEEETLSLRYTEIIADLVVVVKDQNKRISELEKKIKGE